MRRSGRRGVAAGILALGVLALGACSSAPSPSPAASHASLPATSAAPVPATAQFNLFVRGAAPHTSGFRLFVQTGPASVDGTQRTFCGSTGGDTKPCAPGGVPFTIRMEGLAAGSTLSYRFERVDTDGSVEVIDQGEARIDRALVREVTYPEPTPVPTPTA